MLSAVTSRFKNFIGISSSKPETRKRSLEEDSEEDSVGAGEGEPATKRCRPHKEKDEPMIKRSYNRLHKIIREGVSGVCMLASYFTSQSTSEPVMVDTPSRNSRVKFSVSSKPSSSKKDKARCTSDEVVNNRTLDSPRPTPFNHLSSRMSNDDDIQLIEVRGQGDHSDQPTRRPALARRLSSPGLSQSPTPSINPNFKFTPTIGSIASRSMSDVKARPTIKEQIQSKNFEIQKNSFNSKKCGYVTRNPIRGVHDRFFATRMKMRNLSQSGRGSSSAEESFRFEEKVRYRQLLQQFTSSEVLPSSYSVYRAPSRSSSISNSYSSSSFGLVSRSRCNYIWTQEKRRQLEDSLRASTSSSRPLVEGTDSGVSEPTTSKMAKDIPLIDLAITESTSSIQSDDDSEKDSVVFVEEVTRLPSRKNSLEEIFQHSPVFQDSWYKDLRKEYDSRSKTSQKEVERATQVQKSLTESRIAQQSSMDDRLTRRMKFLDLTFPSKVEEIQPEEEPEEFVPLTPEMEVVISDALKRTPASEVLVDKFNIRISRRDIMTLHGLNWLNDEVINFYMNLIMERGENDNYPSVYAFNTFFYPKLVKSSHQSVKRWTKKVDIFSYKLLLVPVHLGMHWCLATIVFRDKAVRYYDSMLGSNDLCLESLLEYLRSEHLDKKSSQYDTSKWKIENVKSIPQQMNGSDCGMFTCKFAEYLSRNVPITFEQQHMPYFRRRMVYEIISGHLL